MNKPEVTNSNSLEKLFSESIWIFSMIIKATANNDADIEIASASNGRLRLRRAFWTADIIDVQSANAKREAKPKNPNMS